jgi:hypothetical protein
MMSSRYGVLCFLLVFVVLLLAYENYETWYQPIQWAARKEAAKKTEGKGEPSPAVEGAQKLPPGDSVALIAQNNIFNPDRKEFPVLTSAMGEQGKPVVRPQIVLYGVMIADDDQTASIANPGRPMHKGEREMKTVKVGDRVGDYEITKILPDRITVQAPGDSFEVFLYDPKAPKKRSEVKTASRPAEVTSTLPAPPRAPAPPGTPQSTSPQPPPAPPGSARQPVIEGQAPRPVTPAPTPDADIWRGRRAPRPPGTAPEGGRN